METRPETPPPLYSAEMTEIIGSPPRWLLRAGSGLLLLFLLLALGVTSVVSIPEQRQFAVRLRGATPPYYLVRGQGPVRLLAVSGQVVRQGQPVALHAADSLRAPFAGTLFYEELTGAATTPADTLGVLVPVANAYRVSGQLAVEWLPELRQQAHLAITVPLSRGGTLALQGRIRYVNPSVHRGQVSFAAQLDAPSNAALRHQFGNITDLDGAILLSRRNQPILLRIFQ
jgi:hypothetical protein